MNEGHNLKGIKQYCDITSTTYRIVLDQKTLENSEFKNQNSFPKKNKLF